MADGTILTGDNPPPPPPPKKEDPVPRFIVFRILVALIFSVALAITTLNATYVCTWLGEYEYNVQIAKHVVILFWMGAMAWTFAFPLTWKEYWAFPKDDDTTFFILGLVCVSASILFFSDTLLVLLYKGNKGVTYITTQGTRVLPNLDPRMLYNASIWMYSVIGGMGIFFWGVSGYRWIAGG